MTDVFQAAAAAMRAGRRAALCTVIEVGGSTPRSSGARMLVFEDGSTVGTIGGGALEHLACARARDASRVGQPVLLSVHLTRDLGMCCGGQMKVYVDPLQPMEPFVVFGAGHVARALVPLLASLDFRVVVVDERDELATAERFPEARVEVADPREWLAASPGDEAAWYLVVTHDHKLDEELVGTLLPRPSRWLGMVGSRAKVARFLVRYRAAGLPDELFAKLRAPVGLDLGAETPAEIAVSIAAEVIRHRRGLERAPVPLADLPLKAREAASPPPRPGPDGSG